VCPRLVCDVVSTSYVCTLVMQGDANVVVAFVGNKCDMANQRKVPVEVRVHPIVLGSVCILCVVCTCKRLVYHCVYC
jgi:hypothetical protein